MQIQSHLLMSDLLFTKLQKQNIILDYKKFRYGNIKPDLCGLFYHHAHRIDTAFDYVVNLMNKLIILDMEEDSAMFSRDLGIACHYLTDFFTFPHNNHYREGLKAHLSLERKMHRQIKEFVNTQSATTQNSYPFPEPNNIYSLPDLLDSIMELHERYMQQTTSNALHDFSFAQFACTTACQNIIILNHQRDHFLHTMQTAAHL